MGKDKRTVSRWAKEKEWPYQTVDGNGGKQKRYHIKDLPEGIQIAYAASLNLSLDTLQSTLKPPLKADLSEVKDIEGYKCRSLSTAGKTYKNLNQCTEAEREIARNRQKVIAAFEHSGLTPQQFVELYQHDDFLTEIKARLGRWGHIGSTAIFYQNWLRRYQQFGLAGLVPQYKARGGLGASLDQDTKNLLEYVYFDTSQPSVTSVIRCIKTNYGISVSEATARRYLQNLPEAVVAYERRGPRFFDEHFQPSIQRDYTLYKPMDIIVGDYMTQDFVLRVKDKVWRAKVVAFMDMRSRVIVGWDLQLTANSTGVATALQRCFDTYGLPKAIYFDNGREFKNYWLCGNEWKIRHAMVDAEDVERNIGIVTEVGVKIIFTKPYHGQSKPIERFWRTVHEMFDKFEQTYVGSNTATRPDEAKVYQQKVSKMKKEDFEKIPTFEEIKKQLGNFIDWYNDKHEHTGQGMDGKTPMQVWRENPVEKREVPEELKPFLFTYRHYRKVQRDGISYNGSWYYNKDKIIEYVGKDVQIRVPLDNDDVIHVFDLAGKPLFDAEWLEYSGNVAADNQKVNELRKANEALVKKYNKDKEELDKQPFTTPSEAYATEKQAVNGEFTSSSESKLELKPVKPRRPVKKYTLFKL
jgi:putative transposase